MDGRKNTTEGGSNSHRRYPTRGLLGFSFLFLLSLAAFGQERYNLPHTSRTIELSSSTSDALRAQLESAPFPTGAPLPNDAQRLLVASLPVDFRAACPQMLQSWGTDAQGTARWALRNLQMQQAEKKFTAVLALRCSSNYPAYSNHYDERLAILVLDLKGARLQLIPFAEECGGKRDCTTETDLFRLTFSREFPVAEGRLIELVVQESNDNPALGGLERWWSEQLHYLLLPDARPVGRVDRAHKRFSHDDQAGDYEKTCRADVQYRRDASGRLLEIASGMRCQENGKPRLNSTNRRRYRWNPRLRILEETTKANP